MPTDKTRETQPIVPSSLDRDLTPQMKLEPRWGVGLVAALSHTVGAALTLVGLAGLLLTLAFSGEASDDAFVTEVVPWLLICLATICWGIVTIIAGIAIVRRRRSGRILGLISGAIAAPVAVLLLWGGLQGLADPFFRDAWHQIILCFFFGTLLVTYTTAAYLVLLNPRQQA